MDTQQSTGTPYPRRALTHRPPALPPPPASGRRSYDGGTPIFDQLLKEWQAGTLRPVVAWPGDEPGATAGGRGTATMAGEPRGGARRPQRDGHDREPVRRASAESDR